MTQVLGKNISVSPNRSLAEVKAQTLCHLISYTRLKGVGQVEVGQFTVNSSSDVLECNFHHYHEQQQ